MLNLGILLIVIAAIIWGAGVIFTLSPAVVVGKVLGAIGVVLLVVALILLLIPAAGISTAAGLVVR